MSAESAHYEFIRLHEWPFNSDTKYMAVKVTPRRSQVGFSAVVYFRYLFFRIYTKTSVITKEIFTDSGTYTYQSVTSEHKSLMTFC